MTISYNIFGKQPQDYKHLQDAKKISSSNYHKILRDGFRKSIAPQFKNNPRATRHDFDVFREDRYGNMFFRDRNIFFDAATGIEFLTSNLAAVAAEIEEIAYSVFRLNDYFPINTKIPEGARSWNYRYTDFVGRAGFIDNNGTNTNTAQVLNQQVAYNLAYGGMKPFYSIEDLREAQTAGIPLDSKMIEGATTACYQHIEQIGLGTAPDQVGEGFLNVSKVPVTTVVTPLNQLTPDEAVQQLKGYINAIVQRTNEIFGKVFKGDMAFYVSNTLDQYLQEYRATFSDMTIWSAVKKDNLWTRMTGRELQLKYLQELDTAGVGGTQRLIIGYPQDDRVLDLGMSIAPRVYEIDKEGRNFTIDLEYKISPGVNAKRPGGMSYIDNVVDQVL